MKTTKKVLAIVLCLCMLMALAACGGNGGDGAGKKEEAKGTALVLGEKNIVENFAEFTLFKMQTAKKITASVAGEIYYENKNSGETYFDMILDITNTSSAAIQSDDFVVASAKNAAGTEYPCHLYAVETNNATYLSQYETIAPLTKVRMHCAIAIPETETDLSVKLVVNGSEYVCDYKVGAVVNNAKAISVGDTVEEADFATMVFKGVEYTDDLLPTNTSGAYNHYAIDNAANTYLVVKFDITNYNSTAKKCDTFLGVKATYMDKYTYTGRALVEDEDEKGFSSYDSIAPLTTRKMYYLIEVPKTVMENPASILISFNGNEYSFAG